MIRSMTAFARREVREDWGSATWEIRSVNHRYLEVYTRLPEDFRALESEIRSRVAAKVRRGKLDCTLRFEPAHGSAGSIEVNAELAGQIARASREVDQLLYNPGPVSSMDVLRWPGVLQMSTPDMERIGHGVLGLLDAALDDLVQVRAREGERIASFMDERLEQVQPQIEAVRQRLPEVLEGARERLHTRLSEIRAEVDAERLEQEIVLFATKLDVAEELDRLHTHVAEARRALQDPKPVGRRLDFLMQELNREANTLGSKSADSQTTKAAVELKVIIEQMREQVQNVE